MNSRLDSEADGRLHRARRPIRKLVALELSEDEVLDLFRHHQQRRRDTHDDNVDPLEAIGTVDERRRVAQAIIRTLIALGFTHGDIASLADLHPASITHLLDRFEGRSVGMETVEKLRSALRRAGAMRLDALLPQIPVRVLDTCNDKGLSVDSFAAATLEDGVRQVLLRALLRSESATLMPGVNGVLAQVGDPEHGVTIIVTPCRGLQTIDQQLLHAQTEEHEAEHHLHRCREARQKLEAIIQQARQADVPKDGPIA